MVLNKTNDNYYTDIIKEKNYPNNKYTFTYLEDESLKNVKLNDEEIVSYEYDNKRLFRKKDIEGVTNYTYDINDNIKEINLKDKYKVKLEYDNLNNLEKQDITIQNQDKLSYSYLYDYEYNEYKIGGYFASLENSFKEDILYEDIKLKYNDSYESNRVNLTLDEALNKKVIRFCYNNSYLTYSSRMINKARIPFSLNNERYNTYDFVTEFYKHN